MRRSPTRQLALTALVSIAIGGLAAGAQAATVTFFDATFADADWSALKVLDTTSGAAAAFSAMQVPSGGNPGSYRAVTHSFGPGSIGVAHTRDSAVYDPATQGAIASLDYAYDLIHIQPPANQAVGFRVLLVQGGAYYIGPSDVIFPETWTSFSAGGLVAGDFSLLAGSGPANPDFTAMGAPLTAGYLSSNTNSGGAATVVRMAGIDNWTVTIHSVPEFSATALLLFGLTPLVQLCRAAQPGSASSPGRLSTRPR